MKGTKRDTKSRSPNVERGGVERGGVESGGVERGGLESGRVESGGDTGIAWRRLAGALNATLFVALVAMIGWNAPDRLSERLGAGAQGTAAQAEVSYFAKLVGPAPHRDVLIRFSLPVGPVDGVGDDAPEGLVRLEPDVPFVATWVDPSRLRLRTAFALPRARRIHVHVNPGRLGSGGSVDALPPPPFAEGDCFVETPPIRILSVVAADHDDDGTARAIVVTTDLRIEDDVFARAVAVRRIRDDGENGAAMDVRITREERPAEYAWHIALPEGELPDGVVVTLTAGLTPQGGDVPLQDTWQRVLTLRPELFVTDIDRLQDGIHIKLNHDIPLPAAGTITIDPPVDLQMRRQWGGLRLYGDFHPGRTYRVTIHEGFPGSGPARLRQQVERSLRLPDMRPRLSFHQNGTVLSSLARHELAVDTVNVGRVEIAARSVFANNVVRLLQERRHSSTNFGPWVKRELSIGGERNVVGTERIALHDVLRTRADDHLAGIHEVRIRDVDGRAGSARRLIQITDLGATVRSTPEATAVRVTSIAHARPVAGAEVTIRTPTNQLLCTGTTAEDGTTILHHAAHGDDRVPFLIEIRKGADLAFVDLDGFEVTLAEEAQSGRPYLRGGYECLVHADRGAVRPGETARVTIVGRSARGVSPVGARVQARWLGPDRGVRRTQSLAFDDSGLLAASFDVATSDATGTWSVEIVDEKSKNVVGATSFLVEAFVPDRLEAAIEMVGEPTLGSRVQLRVHGAWLEGSPATGQGFRAHLRLDHLDLHPEGFESHSFGRVDQGVPVPPPGAVKPVRGVLDDDGVVDVMVSLPKTDASGAQGFVATASVDVDDPSGRRVRAGVRRELLAPGPLLGARVAGDHIELVLVDAAGVVQEIPAAARVSLEHRHWRWELKYRRGRDGRRRRIWVPTVRADPAGAVDAEIVAGRARVVLPDRHGSGGWFVAVVRAELNGVERLVEASLGGPVGRPDRLRVDGPEEPVKPGETATLSVACPTAGTAFVTVESTTVHAVATHDIQRGHDTFDVRIPEDVDGPNAHVVVTVVAPQARADATPPYWIAGATSVPLSRADRYADVTLTAAETVQPGADIEIDVLAPGATHATVALVDEGILRVTGHADPSPKTYFDARRRLETRGADTGMRLLERPGFDPDVLDGGDQDNRAAMAPRLDAATSAVVETVALFQGPLRIDPDGHARLTFSPPEFYEGRLRAIVIAAGPDKVGAASTEITVRAPLGLRIAAPRRLTPDDVSTATVTLRNSTGAAAEIDVEIHAEEGLELRADARRRVALADGASLSFDVQIAATRPAEAPRIDVVAVAGDERRRVRATVPVAAAGRFETWRAGVELAADGVTSVPGRWARGSRTARLVVAPGVGADLLPALEALLGYPHGCVEQTSSRAHAVLACRPLLQELAPEVAKQSEQMIEQGIARLRAMQTPRGGMAFWIGGRDETDLGTLSALDFLLDARAQGFAVEANSLQRLLRRVERRVREREDVAYRAMAIEILSRGGAAVGPWLTELPRRVTRGEDRARVALALSRSGNDAAARALLDGAVETSDEIAAPGGLLFSPTRERAFLLRALLEVAPGDDRVGVLADALRATCVSPHTLTTQAQSHAVRALSALHVSSVRESSMLTGSVFVDGQEHEVRGRTKIDIPADGAGEIRCALSRAASAYLEVRGVRVDAAPAPTDGGLRVSRRIVDLETGEEATRLRRGGLYEVVLDVAVAERTENLLVTDILPAGLEAVSPRFDAAVLSRDGERRPDHTDVRDDRVLLHVDGPVSGSFFVRYRANAVFPGKYATPAPIIEALYVPGSAVRGSAGSDGLEIVD